MLLLSAGPGLIFRPDYNSLDDLLSASLRSALRPVLLAHGRFAGTGHGCLIGDLRCASLAGLDSSVDQCQIFRGEGHTEEFHLVDLFPRESRLHDADVGMASHPL